MSQAVTRLPELTPEEYLAMELAADARHEYVGGRIYLMPGTTVAHWRIVQNLILLLGSHLRGHPCEVFAVDIKLRTATDRFYYPDLMVCCEPTDGQAVFTDHARFVVEVASPSTRRTDESEKADAYWRLPSVEAYVLVEQDVMALRVLRRGPERWEQELLTEPTELLRLESIGFSAPLSAIYARTEVGRAGEQ